MTEYRKQLINKPYERIVINMLKRVNLSELESGIYNRNNQRVIDIKNKEEKEWQEEREKLIQEDYEAYSSQDIITGTDQELSSLFI